MFLKCLRDPARYHHKASESDRAGRGVAKQGGGVGGGVGREDFKNSFACSMIRVK